MGYVPSHNVVGGVMTPVYEGLYKQHFPGLMTKAESLAGNNLQFGNKNSLAMVDRQWYNKQ